MKDLAVSTGSTTSEVFDVHYDGQVWWVKGSRSGRQERTATTGAPYLGDDRRIAFTIGGSATAGDHFEVTTDAGIAEYDVGGIPVALAMSPDQTRLAMIVNDGTTNVLRWFDPATDAVVTGPDPADAVPSRFSFAPDGSLFVGGAVATGAGMIWEIAPDKTVTEHPLPWPAFDVAPMLSDASRLLYVAREGTNELWVLDLDTDTLRDLNTWLDGVQGLDLRAPIDGIEPMPIPYRHPEVDSDGVNPYGRAVAVSLASGRVVFAQEGSGCLQPDEIGPRTVSDSSFDALDYDTNYSTITASGPWLEQNQTNPQHVQVNPCGGVARPETWTLHFDRNQQGWEVDGTLSGVQATLAHEDERYVSADGAVSFLIHSGATPTEDGWRIVFRVDEGIIDAENDDDGDGARDGAFDVPSDPVFFHYRVGPLTGGMRTVDDRPFVLVAAESSDRVGRVEPSTGDVEVDWQ
jgi:hypothetical protein